MQQNNIEDLFVKVTRYEDGFWFDQDDDIIPVEFFTSVTSTDIPIGFDNIDTFPEFPNLVNASTVVLSLVKLVFQISFSF